MVDPIGEAADWQRIIKTIKETLVHLLELAMRIRQHHVENNFAEQVQNNLRIIITYILSKNINIQNSR